MRPRARYAELHAWSNFTFLSGAAHPEELAVHGAELGLQVLALTDRGGLYGAVRFSKAAREQGLAAIIGAELALDDGTPLVLLAVDADGYARLVELISRTQLDAVGILAAARLSARPNHLVCSVAGLVVTRQRPGTAKGFVFLTLEDETGLVNVIVNPQTYERYRRVIRQSAALIVDGVLQQEDGVVHVIARKCRSLDLDGLADGVRARNFH
ncbi:MAG TPA: PHP domain-containing protein [Candidatus Baltobacteraceae bacterium]|jgi:DNA polymerase III alpha subunit|nr:PHP domain-containing protein [Candidatus Baltobacteraceae bacterium]